MRTDTWTPVFEPLVGHKSAVKCVDFSPNAQRIASCSSDGTLRLWNIENGCTVGVVPVAYDEMWNIAFCPKGNILLPRQTLVWCEYGM